MVEVYRPSGEPNGTDPLTGVDHDNVVGSIDIPSDELTLYLVEAPDAASAERVMRGRGIRPIRVVDVRWQLAGLLAGIASGHEPKLHAAPERAVPTSASSDQPDGQLEPERR